MWAVITTVAGFIWDAVQAGLDAIIVALQWAAGALKTGLLGAWQAVRWTWADIIKPVGQFLGTVFDRLKSLYTTVVKPALDWLRRVTSALRRVYNTLLRPLLNIFDRVRQVLQLLELLHVPFAAKLDAELADLERKLSLPLQLVIRVLNGLSNRVESYVLTVDNLFQRVTHLNSIGRDITAIRHISWNHMITGIDPAKRHAAPAPAQLATTDQHLATLDSAFTDDSVDDVIDMAGALQVLDDALTV